VVVVVVGGVVPPPASANAVGAVRPACEKYAPSLPVTSSCLPSRPGFVCRPYAVRKDAVIWT
jgi:hypothetical protein